MRQAGRSLIDWIASRWRGVEEARAFLGKPLPTNVSWLHTLGGLLLVYLLLQALTGILLGFYYSPSPENALSSVGFVRDKLFLGEFVYRLHHFGAGFVVVTLLLHLARSYFSASYKAPRELLWLTGLLLSVLVMLFAFTGQLLPFDQQGYWATVVGIRIASGVPLLGETIRSLLTGGYGDIGATTMSRFYVLHLCVLPLAMVVLVSLHLGMLQKVGSAGPTDGGSPKSTHAFFPRQAMKDVLVAAGGAAVLFLVAALVSVERTGAADPVAGSFVPRPEWFFLAHYEVLKWLPGRWQVAGTFVLPAAVFAVLLGLPFFDRRPERSPRRRRFAISVGLLVCAAVVGLTTKGFMESSAASSMVAGGGDALDLIARGRRLFGEKKCVTCHAVAGNGGTKGPDLTHVGRRLRADYLPEWIRNPRNISPSTEMPSFEGSQDELDAVVEYLLSLK